MPCRTASLAALHAPKTGGTWARRVLEQHGGKAVPGEHSPRWKLPQDYDEGRTLFATVRDPWAWYCSWWLHAMNNDASQRAMLAEWGNGSMEFDAVLYGVTHPDRVAVPSRPGVIFDADCPRPSSWGLCTWTLRYIYGTRDMDEWVPQVWLSTDKLHAGMSELLDRPVDLPKANARESRHGRQIDPRPYVEWYDADMMGWVADADRDIIDHFDFSPFAGMPAPLRCA